MSILINASFTKGGKGGGLSRGLKGEGKGERTSIISTFGDRKASYTHIVLPRATETICVSVLAERVNIHKPAKSRKHKSTWLLISISEQFCRSAVSWEIEGSHVLLTFSSSKMLWVLRLNHSVFIFLCHLLSQSGWVAAARNVTRGSLLSLLINIAHGFQFSP